MANRKSRTISTSEDTESPFLRSPKKKQYGIFERDHVGKSFVLIILGAFAGSLLTAMAYRIGPFAEGAGNTGDQQAVRLQPAGMQQGVLQQSVSSDALQQAARSGAESLSYVGGATWQAAAGAGGKMPAALAMAQELAAGQATTLGGQAMTAGGQAMAAAGQGIMGAGQGKTGSVKDAGEAGLPPQTFYSPHAFPWTEEIVQVQVCDNSCETARDSVCDDGRQANKSPVKCDLGTDCADCGPWTYRVPKSLASQLNGGPPIRPVQQLVKRGLQVYTRRTTTVPSFIMPYTNWKHDVDVSDQMEHAGAVEQGLTQVWYMQLRDLCRGTPEKPPGLVVDVGGNFGWYSLFSAAAGCRVVAWEPVPHFRLFFMYGVMLNHFGGSIQIRTNAVADKPEGRYELVVPQRGIWGTASIDGSNIDRGINNEGDYERVIVQGERVDDVVKQDVVLIKFDVEGFEPTAFASAAGLFDNFRVENLCMEYSPGVYERQNKWDKLEDWPNMLSKMLSLGMRILHVKDSMVRQNLLLLGWDGELNADFEEVVAENLKYDQRDNRRLATPERQLVCPMHLEMREAFPTWGCSFIPEGLHPKSFRSVIGHNTNIFATLRPHKYKITGPVGVFGLDEPLTQWLPQKSGGRVGMGGRPCQYLNPEVQVVHRCKCTVPDVCGAQEDKIFRLAAEKKTFPLYIDLLETS